MKILIINAGSSSLKYQLFDMPSGNVLAKGNCERIGCGGTITHKVPGRDNFVEEKPLANHEEALSRVFELLTDKTYGVIESLSEIAAVGHRVAHGGEKYRKSSLVDDELIEYLEYIAPINPLHGPPAISGIKSCRKLLPNVKMVTVFDTAFYSELKPENYLYGIPYKYYENDGIRRYGFHGTSHRFVSMKAAELMGKPLEEIKMITCHIGSGSSITAIKDGHAVDTTMGFTPQEGILMGTRSGNIDPTVIPYLMKKYSLSPDEMDRILNKESGFIGVSGVASDYRGVERSEAAGNTRAGITLNMLALGIKKYIGSFTAEMNGLDALIFTAGIGENSADLRRRVLENLEYLGICPDFEKNGKLFGGAIGEMSLPESKVRIFVIPTNEEYMIALDTMKLTEN